MYSMLLCFLICIIKNVNYKGSNNMTYLFCAIISVLLLFYLETNQCNNISGNKKYIYSKNAFNFILIILLIYWTLVIGLQYDTGTDYNSYKNIFKKGKFYRSSNEFLFYYFALFLSKHNIHYQFGFIIIALLQFILFFVFLKKMSLLYNYLFIYLFFFTCVAFYNQTNAIRQFVAVYIFLLSLWFAYKRKIWFYIISIIIASFFHASALALLPIYFLSRIKPSEYFLFFLLLICFIISLIEIDKFTQKIIPLFSIYEKYLTHEWAMSKITTINKLMKYIYVPFYLFSLACYKNLNEKDKYFFNVGFVSFCLIVLSLSSRVLTRFSMYLWIPAIFPLYHFLSYLLFSRNIIRYEKLFIIVSFLLLTFSILFIKVIIFPSNEYVYKSIFFVEISRMFLKINY